MPKSKAVQAYEARVTEQYLLTQFDYHYQSESFRDHKDRMEEGDRLYRGDLRGLFPDETKLPDRPYVENKYKNALHDLARLASEGKGSAKFMPRGSKNKDMQNAQIQESIVEGYWRINKMQQRERKLYLDLAGSGMMAVALYYDDRSPYPQATILNPRFIYPDVRNGMLQSVVSVEVVRERVLARQFPHLGLNAAPDNTREAHFICLYDEEGVSEAVLLSNGNKPAQDAKITRQWTHGLGCVPVAFEQLDTWDGAFHGILEQLAGPLMVRNKIMRYLVDEAEQLVYAPWEERGIENPTDPPGVDTIYHHDDNVDGQTFMRRTAPSTPSQAIWGVIQYMGDQEEKEAIQPPSRSGNVSQAIASGSFVDRTQGQLTSVVKELQDKMASFREQFNDIAMKIDERFLDTEKPLVRPVAGKVMYTPSEAIDEWYFHEVKFGAGAGLDRLNADTRVLNHLSARLISREEARAEIDYLDDSASSQDKIDRENLQDVIMQRMATNPATPMSSIGKVWLEMKTGGSSLEEALEKHMPEIISVEEQARAAQGGPQQPAGIPGEVPEAAPTGGAEQLDITQPLPPLAQLFPGRNFNP